MTINTQSFKASEPIDAGMAVAYNPQVSEPYEPRVHRALADELVVGIATQGSDANGMLSLAAFMPGNQLRVLVGETVTKGDELGLKPISASAGEAGVFYTTTTGGAVASKIVAMENAAEGELCSAVCFTCPTVAEKASALDTGGQYVGGPDRHMYFLPTGVPVNSSVNIGSDSQPMYMAGGKFKACTSVGGSAPEFFESSTIRDTSKSGDLGNTDGAKVHYYWAISNNDIMLSMPTGQTQPMIIQGVVTSISGVPSSTTVAIPMAFCKYVSPLAQPSIALKPYIPSCESFKIECTLIKA